MWYEESTLEPSTNLGIGVMGTCMSIKNSNMARRIKQIATMFHMLHIANPCWSMRA